MNNNEPMYIIKDRLYQVKLNELNLMNNKNFEGVFNVSLRDNYFNEEKTLEDNNLLNRVLNLPEGNIVICYGKDIHKSERMLIENYKSVCLWNIEENKRKLKILKDLEEDIKIENMGNE